MIAQTSGLTTTVDLQTRFDPNNKDALWGAYNYTPDKDVDQLTWTFIDMTSDSGRMALMWGNTLASTPFKAMAQK